MVRQGKNEYLAKLGALGLTDVYLQLQDFKHITCISSAFGWSNSPQGWKYWREVSHNLQTMHPANVPDIADIAEDYLKTNKEIVFSEYLKQQEELYAITEGVCDKPEIAPHEDECVPNTSVGCFSLNSKLCPPSPDKEVEKALRFNSNKPELNRIPMDTLISVAKVLSISTKKYPDSEDGSPNWSKLWGTDTINLCMNCSLRHMEAINRGELIDKESGQPHAAHIICNQMFIIRYMENEGIK